MKQIILLAISLIMAASSITAQNVFVDNAVSSCTEPQVSVNDSTVTLTWMSDENPISEVWYRPYGTAEWTKEQCQSYHFTLTLPRTEMGSLLEFLVLAGSRYSGNCIVGEIHLKEPAPYSYGIRAGHRHPMW